MPPTTHRGRRVFLYSLGAGTLALAGGRLALPRLLRRPAPRPLTGELTAFVEGCFAGLNRSKLVDTHVHLVGLDECGNGCTVNPELRSLVRHPWKSLQMDVYLAVSGVDDLARADDIYLERLLALHALTNPRGRLLVLAFDRHVRPDGSEAPELSEFFTPDERVLAVAARHPDVVIPCASVHPYRRDAVERLDRAAAGGARAVKWLPNAMGIDPASPQCDAFYTRLATLGLPLLTHTGDEQAVDARDAQRLGNPLRLRRPLDAGVRVIAAHCASTGTDEDLDAPEAGRTHVPSFDLFMRLMREPQHEGRLFGDISAITQRNRCGRPLRTLLEAQDLHGRLLNGSDYPLPSVGALVVGTGKLRRLGYLTEEEERLCDAVFEVNPLLFDFVVKRCLKVESGDRTHRFSNSVFETARIFG